MSTNKYRFYDVTTVTTVMALNQTDAKGLAHGRKGVRGEVLASVDAVERISATEARDWAESQQG